jgi:Na+-transporting methylmalonyl-CoA/oxaloacetate decarboxylase gamma subunit
MDANLIASFSISAIAVTVIFLVLTILIFLIKTLVHLIPYQEPPAPPPRPKPVTEPAGETDEHIAAITASLATYIGQPSDSFQIVEIKPL